MENGFFTQHQVKVFCYNQQVVDASPRRSARTPSKAGVPVVGVYETMPTPGYDYQTWMMAEVNAIREGRHHRHVHRAPVSDLRRTVEQPPATWRGTQVLDVEGVSVALGGRQVLDQVSFTVAPGSSPGSSAPTVPARPPCCESSWDCRHRDAAGSCSRVGPGADADARSATCPRRSCSIPTCPCGPGT